MGKTGSPGPSPPHCFCSIHKYIPSHTYSTNIPTNIYKYILANTHTYTRRNIDIKHRNPLALPGQAGPGDPRVALVSMLVVAEEVESCVNATAHSPCCDKARRYGIFVLQLCLLYVDPITDPHKSTPTTRPAPTAAGKTMELCDRVRITGLVTLKDQRTAQCVHVSSAKPALAQALCLLGLSQTVSACKASPFTICRI